ncbi:ATP-binding protein [Embleya sp. NPDC020630]|uniref:ATP-binding protein n=1 Tax=Embleya sp. NPDC020630 TaxID=3363979 RepID=UPI00379FFBD7
MLQQQLPAEESVSPVPSPAPTVRRIEPGDVKVRFKAHPRRVEQMRKIACSQLRYCGHRDGEAVYMVGVVVSELVTNAVRHGAGDTVTFALRCDESGAIRIEVDDHSSGRPEIREPDNESEEGRGLVIVEALASAWGREGSCTWCTFPAEGGVAA